MKRCLTCNRTFTDPNLSYCIDDGTPLTTEVDDDPPYRPPSAYVPPGAMPSGKKRRKWPWVVGILGAFLLGAVALTVAAVILVPRLTRSRPSNAPTVVTADEPERTESVDAPAPTDKEQVLEQLTQLENEWTVANINADKKKLDRILADDYVGQAPPPDTGLQDKRQYLDNLERDTVTERWEFTDLKLDLSGDRATINGKITFFGRGTRNSYDFTDKFVWRKGRWQAIGSEGYLTQ